jgi:S1-C subfamily serine protease
MRKFLALLLLFLPFAGCKQQPPNPTDLYAMYRSSVVLIQSAYYFKVKLPSGTELFCTYNDEYPNFYDTEEEAKAGTETAYGTGFFISEKGEIATNRHVVFPEDNTTMQSNIASAISEMAESIRSEITELESEADAAVTGHVEETETETVYVEAYESEEAKQERRERLRDLRKRLVKFEGAGEESETQLRIELKRTFLGVVFNDSRGAETGDYSDCIAIANAPEEAVDLALIQLKSKKTPEAVTKIFTLSDIPKDPPKLNDPVYMIGFNAGIELASTAQGIKSQFTQGTITQDPDGVHLLYSIPTLPGSSGSPIIDKWGHLVAVNFAKLRDFQSFSFGIPAPLLRTLYSETQYRISLKQAPEGSKPVIAETKPDSKAVSTGGVKPGNEEQTKALLTRFLAAEDNRDFDQIYPYFAKPMRRYYDLQTPNYENMRKRYEYLWSFTSDTHNELLSIVRAAPNTYDLKLNFSYYNLKKETAVEKVTTVRMIVDEQGGIAEIYGLE